jgi:flagellar biosynthetic protein FlhB
MLLALVGLLRFWLPNVLNKIADLFKYSTSLSLEWNVRSVWEVMMNLSWQCLLIMGPIFLASLVAALVINFLQVGTLFTVEPLKPQLSRLSPIQGLKRMFGLKALVQLVKSLFKVFVIGYFLFDVIRDNINIFPALQGIDVFQSATLLGGLLFQLAWKAALAFLIIAFVDFLYQWWEYEKNLRMSHEEIKEEYKQTEGDPLLKAQIKKRQRALAMRRMMEDLKKADVVITNPTHYAVALRYDLAIHPAPYVVAKGQNELALRIRAIAEENKIVIMENKPLARTLFVQAELGQVVPTDLYKAVAEVLAFVYKLNKRKHYYSA